MVAWIRRRGRGGRLGSARIGNHLDSQRVRNAKTWERLRDHPDPSRFAVREGNALNFLLHRISAAAPAVLSLNNPAQNPALTPQVLHDLRLRQNAGGGRFSVFRADEGIALEVDWWPYVFREETFRPVRLPGSGVECSGSSDALPDPTIPSLTGAAAPERLDGQVRDIRRDDVQPPSMDDSDGEVGRNPPLPEIT